MSTLSRSPLPWKRGTDGLIFDANNEYITDTCGTSLPGGEENQKYIVRAVNSHAELLEACRALVALCMNHEESIDCEWGACRNIEGLEADGAWSEQIYQARKAIQKAESGDTETP